MEIPGYAVLLVVAGVTLGIGATILNTVQSGLTGVAASTVGNASAGISNLAQQFGNIGLVLGLAAILVILMGVLGMFGERGKR
jgi:hypothetical protein